MASGTPWRGQIDLKKVGMMISLLILALEYYSSPVIAHAHLLRSNHPLRQVIDQVNEQGPYIGLVMAYYAEELALLQAPGLFVSNSIIPWVDLSGRRFNIGTVRGMNVIYVMSGQRRLNAGLSIQILINAFDIKGIVHFGTAGSSNNSLSFGDVSIPKQLAFTGSWKWKKFKSEEGQLSEINFGKYNIPQEGENLLGEIEYKTEEFFSIGEGKRDVFWLDIHPAWFSLAAQLQDVELQQCVNTTYCLPKTPKVVHGLKGSTADIFVDNEAYRKFLFDKFEVSTVDEESSAIVMTALSNKVPCIVIRGVSDLAGGGVGWASTNLSSLAATNSLSVAVKFIELVGEQEVTGVKEGE